MRRFFSDPMTVILILVLFASSLFGGRFDNPLEWLMSMVMLLPAIVIGLSFHEFAHAAAAYKLGDMTPKNQGRVTISPASHVDPLGFIALMLIGFGWGVPVQINPRNFNNQRRDELIVSLAGVTMNFIIAIVFMGILKLLIVAAPAFIYSSTMGDIVFDILYNVVTINIVLMVFNLLPIPPLDGFNIITLLFNLRKYQWWYTLYRNGFLILMILILFNITGAVLGPVISVILSFIVGIFF